MASRLAHVCARVVDIGSREGLVGASQPLDIASRTGRGVQVPDDLEIERKFVVIDASVVQQAEGAGMVQAYLVDAPERTVRVRLNADGPAFLTVKGPRSGPTRVELECAIPFDIAEQLLEACMPAIVSKTRYPIVSEDHIWVIDVFHDANEGLILAELELSKPDEAFAKPQWCGDEVTDDERYYNNYLARHPFTEWR
jgi:adenylate cyclase